MKKPTVSCKNDIGVRELGVVYVYLELSKELGEQNAFANFQRLLNLIYLETGLMNTLLINRKLLEQFLVKRQ